MGDVLRLGKHFVLYDSEQLNMEGLFADECDRLFFAGEKYAFCRGCFDCWLKTPGTCSMRDRVHGLANHLADCSNFVIVSKLSYGGFSSRIKGVVDRLIAFNLPYFKKINGELHHVPRYDRQFALAVFFYGEATEQEKETAREYVSRMALNLNNDKQTTVFINRESEWRAAYDNLIAGL